MGITRPVSTLKLIAPTRIFNMLSCSCTPTVGLTLQIHALLLVRISPRRRGLDGIGAHHRGGPATA